MSLQESLHALAASIILEIKYQHQYASNDAIVSYLCKHFISFIEVIEQYGDLGFIRTPGQELAKSPLHALHFVVPRVGRKDFLGYK